MKIKVIGRRYSETAKFYDWDTDKVFPYFEKEGEQTWEIEADTLQDGVQWLAENHPEMYMGGSVVCENGDFTCFAVPCVEYGKGNYETIEARVAFAKADVRRSRDMSKDELKKAVERLKEQNERLRAENQEMDEIIIHLKAELYDYMNM